jgi:Trypsin-co-occurring domain 1
VASQVVRYRVDDSTVVGFEVELGSGWHQAGANEVVGRVREAVEPAVAAAKAVLEKVKDAKPDEVEVKFGIKVTGEANWIVARAATEGSFEVTLTWSPSGGQAAPAAAPDPPAAAP